MMRTGPRAPTDGPARSARERLPRHVWVLGAVMLLLGVTTLVLMFTPTARGGSTLFLLIYSLPANTAVTVFPAEPILIHYGKFASVWTCAAVVTVMTLVAGVLDHRVFVPVLQHRKIAGYRSSGLYRRVATGFGRYPFAIVAAAAFAPLPFFPVKFLTFSTGYPLVKYLGALALGRLPKYSLLAWLGSVLAVPAPLIVALLALLLATLLIRTRPFGRRRARSA